MRASFAIGAALLLLTSATAFAQPQVTRTSVAKLQLQAGGEAATLTLDGVNLGTVTGARAVLNGIPVSGIAIAPSRRATPPPGRTVSQLAYDLTAAASVPTGIYQLELLAGRQRVLVPVSIEVVGQSGRATTAAAAPSVASASPASVTLTAGGPAQTVVLDGANLDGVTGAHVERNGAAVQGVTVQLQPASGAARRSLALSVPNNASPPWDVPLELVLEASLNRTARAPLQIVAVAPPRADLTVESMDLRDQSRFGLTSPTAGNRIQITAQVRNRTGVSAADMAFVCRRRPLNSGAVLDEVSVRTGPIPANGTKSVLLNISGPSASGPGHMSCIVDDNDDVPEADESNNEVGTAFTAYPEVANDFSIEIRNVQTWTPDPNVAHKTIRFEVANMGPRGAMNPPPPNVPHRVRWQAECTMPLRPFTRIRTVGNMTLYPGGDLPEPGVPQQGSMWLFPIENTSQFPALSTLPATLQMLCNLRVGAFMPNIPVLHAGENIPRLDWGAPQIWWSRGVILNIPNPEAR